MNYYVRDACGNVFMSNFGEWFGKYNGKNMLAAVLPDATKEQARAAITTYCMIFDIEVDTKDWDDLMVYVYNCWNCWFDSIDEMDNYMCELLV